MIGSFNKNIYNIQTYNSSNIKIIYNPKDLKTILKNCELYIGAAGMTLYEVLYLQIIPFVINTNSKQDNFTKTLIRKKLLYKSIKYNKINLKTLRKELYFYLQKKFNTNKFIDNIAKFNRLKNNLF